MLTSTVMGEPDRPHRAPAVDERLVMPETRAEILRGALLMPPPADEPHGTSHFDLTYVLAAHVAPEYRGAVDMLTRTSGDSDFAPDASVFPKARDPKTGGRQLEELAFEIVGEQWMGVPSEKARELARRGVRRIFCVVLQYLPARGGPRDNQRVLEWSRETDGWKMLAEDAHIEDRCFATRLPIRALLHASEVDTAVVAALRERGALRELEGEWREEGRLAARRASVLDLCEALDVDLTDERRAHVEALDAPALEAFIEALKRERRWPA